MKKNKKFQSQEYEIQEENFQEDFSDYYPPQPQLRYVSFAPAKKLTRFTEKEIPAYRNLAFQDLPDTEVSEEKIEEFITDKPKKEKIKKEKKEKPKKDDSKKEKSAKERGVKKILIASVVMVLIAGLLLGSFLVASLFGVKTHIDTASKYAPVLNRGLTPELDELGYYTFTLPENNTEPFKILQLTDLHLGGGFLSLKKDGLAISAIYKLVNSVKPDLIVITGDALYAEPFKTGNSNNLICAEILGSLMEKMAVPWTITYGNHDCEGLKDKSEISAYFESLEHCLFQKGHSFNKTENTKYAPEGNTFINILNFDKSHNTSLVLLDSNMYVKTGTMKKYDNIHDEQVLWYESELIKLADKYTAGSVADFETLAFYHIPNNEFKNAWDKYMEADISVTWLGGYCNERDYLICAPYFKGNIFDKMLELGSTKAVFVGHDHLNNWAIDYEGIVFSYGLPIDYIAYMNIEDEERGGTVITLEPWEDKNYNFKIDKIKLNDIL